MTARLRGHPTLRSCSLRIWSLLIWSLVAAACSTGESIRVRDSGELLFAGRARKTETVSESERHRIALGAELGGYGTNGQYGTPAGPRDYRLAIGYAAFVTEIGVGDFTILPKLGVGAIDFAVAGQTTTVGDDGLGILAAIEGRYGLCPHFDVFGRATSFARSSLESSMFEFGVGFRPLPQVLLELGYGQAGVVVDDASDIFSLSDEADVEIDGLLLSMTLQF